VLLVCLSIVLIVAAGCVPIPPTAAPTAVPTAAPAAPPSTAITDILWQWTSVSNKTTDETTTVATPEKYTITFREDGSLTGQADCNTFTGTYSQEDGFSMTVTPDVMAACGGDSLDQQYLVLLEDIVAGGPDGAGGLALETAGGEQRMLFVNGGAAASSAPAPSDGITDIVWQWTSVSNKTTNETTTVTTPENYTITFRDDGTLSGKADCNNFTGTYSQEGGFTITLGTSTMAACAEGSLDQQYLELLSAVVAGGPDGQGNLALENAGGEKRMLFKNGGAAPAQ
jgi:heat shock protein HslJ